MITVLENDYIRDKTCRFDLVGLAADAKPAEIFQERLIQNGSTFLEMDTGALYWYDAAEKTWIAFGGEA